MKEYFVEMADHLIGPSSSRKRNSMVLGRWTYYPLQRTWWTMKSFPSMPSKKHGHDLLNSMGKSTHWWWFSLVKTEYLATNFTEEEVQNILRSHYSALKYFEEFKLAQCLKSIFIVDNNPVSILLRTSW